MWVMEFFLSEFGNLAMEFLEEQFFTTTEGGLVGGMRGGGGGGGARDPGGEGDSVVDQFGEDRAAVGEAEADRLLEVFLGDLGRPSGVFFFPCCSPWTAGERTERHGRGAPRHGLPPVRHPHMLLQLRHLDPARRLLVKDPAYQLYQRSVPFIRYRRRLSLYGLIHDHDLIRWKWQ